MRKLTTTLMAVMSALLLSVNVQAALDVANVTIPQSALTLPTTGLSDQWAGKVTTPYFIQNDMIVFMAYETYQSKQQPWAASNSNGSSSGKTWEATDCFLGSTGWGLGTQASTKSETERIYSYRVTNCIGAKALVAAGSNGKRTVFLSAYEVTDNTITTPVQTASMESSTPSVLSLSDLSASKEYVIVVYSNGEGSGGAATGNSNYYEFAFQFPTAAPTTPSVSAVTIAGVDATIDQAGKTITAELPFGTDIAAAWAGATITLGGTATSYQLDGNYTTLTVTDGQNNEVYTLNITINPTDYSKVCGLLVKATSTGSNSADVEGNLPATVDKNTQSGGKLGSNGHYFGIILSEGTFRKGDIVNIHTTVGSAILQLFSDKGNTLLVEAEGQKDEQGANIAGDNLLILPAEAEGLKQIYLYRTADGGSNMNPTVDYIEITRDCNPDILSFTIAGITAKIDKEQKTITAELPYGTVLSEEDWNNAYSLNAVATGATYGENHATLTITDGATYTLNITIAEALSTDATLKSIIIGTTDIELVAETYEYSVELPYGTAAVPELFYETNDITALAEVTAPETLPGVYEIKVTAQDGTTQLTYTVSLTVANAPTILVEAVFSNGVKGFIDNTQKIITVPYLAGSEQPAFVSGKAEREGAEVTFADGKVLVPGEDGKTGEFTINFVAYNPAELALGTDYTFTGSEIGTWVASVYGWDTDKGMKFAKAVEDASNRRISEGKTRIYIFVPACDNVVLTSNGTARDIIVSVNGTVQADITSTGKETITIATGNIPAMIGIESNQTGGDGGFKAIKLVQVEQVAVTGISLDQEYAQMTVGGTLTLVATITPENATNKNIIWSSSNEAIATVENGVVTALAADYDNGVIITAKTEDGGFEASCSVFIAPALTKIYFDTEEFDTNIQYEEGLQLPLPLIIEPTNANMESIVVTSGNQEVVTINAMEMGGGMLMYTMSIVGVGQSTITATAPNCEDATMTITVFDTPSGIENIAGLDTNAPVYNVLGQRVDTNYKGIVIQNGQKYLLK